ncbi:hypothetical protein L7F22_000010 [Adiantum nelumboides]|nr:hypothetical protein [Adiantum nelumboides]
MPAVMNLMMMKKSFLAVLAVLVAVLVAACSGRFFTGTIHPSFSSSSSCHCLDKLSGVVEDCCCDYATVNSLNREALHPILQNLVRTPFFRYFKAKLWCDCPFWPDDGMCRLRDCSVCECPDGEFPETLKSGGKTGGSRLSLDDLICQEGKPEALVDRTLDPKAFKGWAVSRDNPWTLDDEREDEGVTYLNLLLNPERYTGYVGPSACRIWEAIYHDNVLVPQDKLAPPESRVLYKLISGLHSSISVHIAADYLLDESANRWGPNVSLLHQRILMHEDRVRNLYFTFLFVLRAVTKASNYLVEAEYSTGNPSEDEETTSLIQKLVQNERLQAACPKPFDEAKLWQGKDGTQLLLQLQEQFRNISALMDCVGCEKCRLWGKLQILGLGTALEILFSEDLPNPPVLQRNEVIALVNLLSRLSESLIFLHDLAPLVKEPLFFGLGNVFKHWKYPLSI